MTAISADLAPAATPRSRRGRFALIAAALLAPMALINLVAFVFPVLRLAQISFQESRSSGVLTDVYSFRNYLGFFTDSFNLSLIANSLAMSFAVTLATLACAYPIAMFLHRAPAHWRNILFVITVSPLLVSSVVRTYGWMVLLGDQGLVNGALLSLGLAPLRLVNNMTGVFIGLVEILMPYMALSLMAGFGRLETSHEEAAASLGAGPFTRFRRIVLPLTLPGIALGCLLCFVLAISSFITPKLLGGGRVFLLATEIYDQAVIQLQWPMAATISVIVLIIFGAALAAYARIVRRFD